MRNLTTIVATVALLIAGVCRAEETQTPPTASSPTQKLGPQVRNFLKTRQVGPLTVVLVGSSRLFKDTAAFEQFCCEHGSEDRRVLRREVIRRLQEIAQREQDKILRPLGDVAEHRRLWIVNAIWARLTPEQIRLAASLDEVSFIFFDWPAKKRLEPNRVEEILLPFEERPFDAGDKVIPWDLYELRIPEVWQEFSVTGQGVVVAMAGQGANYLHGDIRRRIWLNPGEVPENGRDDDGNGYVDDVYGYDMAQHKSRVFSRLGDQRGAWTCGLVAGDGSGGKVTGAAPEARLMLLKVRGSHLAALLSVQYAVSNGADVMHLDVSYRDLGRIHNVWQRMCEHATCAGLVMVAGVTEENVGSLPRPPMGTPQDIPCVLTVGGVAPNGRLPVGAVRDAAIFGDSRSRQPPPQPDRRIKPDVLAFQGPGLQLLQGNDVTGYLPSDVPYSSHLFASARAAGVAALMLSARPDLPAWRVPEILTATASGLAPLGKNPGGEAGLIDAHAATRAVLALPDSDR